MNMAKNPGTTLMKILLRYSRCCLLVFFRFRLLLLYVLHISLFGNILKANFDRICQEGSSYFRSIYLCFSITMQWMYNKIITINSSTTYTYKRLPSQVGKSLFPISNATLDPIEPSSLCNKRKGTCESL